MDAKDSCVAVIFTSTRASDHDEDYALLATQMDELVRLQPGYLNHVSVRDPVTREGITVAYFTDEESVALWGNVAEHAEAQQLGRSTFYSEYAVQVSRVLRSYRFPRVE